MKYSYDIALKNRLLNKNIDAFNELYEETFPQLYQYCKKHISNDHACEKILHNTQSKTLHSLENYSGDEPLFSSILLRCEDEIDTELCVLESKKKELEQANNHTAHTPKKTLPPNELKDRIYHSLYIEWNDTPLSASTWTNNVYSAVFASMLIFAITLAVSWAVVDTITNSNSGTRTEFAQPQSG